MNRREHGTFIVEFAIIAAGLFIVLFAVIELSRLIWVWNSIDEATRRGARVAAVCPINHPDVRNATVFASYTPGSTGSYSSGDSTILRNLTTNNVDVRYLAEDGVTKSTDFETVRYVKVAIGPIDNTSNASPYVVPVLIPFFNLNITLPTFETTLPAESLGLVPDPDNPDNTYCTCFGTNWPCTT